MYNIFYDTGNDVFFSHIADAFCAAALKYIARRSEEFMQQGGTAIDTEKLKNFLQKANERTIVPLNCGLFYNCADHDCKENYRAVLTSDQIERFSQSIKDAISAFYRNPAFAKTTRERVNLQEAFQNYYVVSNRGIKEIPISSENNPIEFKKSNLRKYKSAYVARVGKMLDEEADADADIFVYVRARTGSHYHFFSNRIRLPNLRPCDFLQVV